MTGGPATVLSETEPQRRGPDDFDAFWAETISGAQEHPLDVRAHRVESALRTVNVYDVSFAGFGGEPIRAWLRMPQDAANCSGAIVEYVGYGNGRGQHIDNLLWSSAGYLHLTLDTRGQGSVHSIGHTPDAHGSGPAVPGFATKGIHDPREYYYRRLIVDAVRAVAAVRCLEAVDPEKVALFGASQGGGIALAVAGLVDGLAGVIAKVPFLCDIPRSLGLAESGPYLEIVSWLRVHTGEEETALRTLSYVDAVNFSSRATAPVSISAALRDQVCPEPGIRKAYEAYAGQKTLQIWPYAGHDGGGSAEDIGVLEFCESVLRGEDADAR